MAYRRLHQTGDGLPIGGAGDIDVECAGNPALGMGAGKTQIAAGVELALDNDLDFVEGGYRAVRPTFEYPSPGRRRLPRASISPD